MAFERAVEDRFGGLTVSLNKDTASAFADAAVFDSKLAAALEAWQAGGKRAVWLKFSSDLAHLVGCAVRQGFDFHHAKPGYVMLTKWLASGQSGLPAYPHHQVGVGGMVLDGQGNVLCIQEKRGMTAGMKDFWKLPGGLVDAGEDLCDAAVREVREETGIETVFECFASVREMHTGPFGCTDLYMICVLRVATERYDGKIPAPRPQDEEIAATEWRDLRGFLDSPYYRKGLYGTLLREAAAVATQRLEMAGGQHGMAHRHMKGLSKTAESLYYPAGSRLPRDEGQGAGKAKAAPRARL
eukprot:TRINITY_DN126068_c0_g1_i1.p1 TRINITY_DN126068_c0_g1~~TRINITY_DN126068_c0_g1_i1.p1  ORF type:complete len:326 (+),score=63.43 TRINITY_DN126068_c0_g1_i1:85-978(+)